MGAMRHLESAESILRGSTAHNYPLLTYGDTRLINVSLLEHDTYSKRFNPEIMHKLNHDRLLPLQKYRCLMQIFNLLDAHHFCDLVATTAVVLMIKNSGEIDKYKNNGYKALGVTRKKDLTFVNTTFNLGTRICLEDKITMSALRHSVLVRGYSEPKFRVYEYAPDGVDPKYQVTFLLGDTWGRDILEEEEAHCATGRELGAIEARRECEVIWATGKRAERCAKLLRSKYSTMHLYEGPGYFKEVYPVSGFGNCFEGMIDI